jgi:hypothetical protein
MKLITAFILASTLSLIPATTSCSKINFPSLDTVEQVVYADFTAGDTDVQIVEAVAALYAGQTGVDAVKIADDVLQMLIDAGIIPAVLSAKAQALHLKFQATMAARATK